jgi:hypothetical protein
MMLLFLKDNLTDQLPVLPAFKITISNETFQPYNFNSM